jgi:isocitrate dehydrogenase
MFDVIVMPNLYGDVASDIAAQISGSVGIAGSANIGEVCSMFEAIHGSAPTIAGQNIANPSALLMGALMMLDYLGQYEVAAKIKNAWLKTLEDGIHTEDIYHESVSTQKVGTKEFADAIIANLGQLPQKLQAEDPSSKKEMNLKKYVRETPAKKVLKGVDVFVDWTPAGADNLAKQLQELNGQIKLSMITNRGVKVWPSGFDETFHTDHWRCRFEVENGDPADKLEIPRILAKAAEIGIDVIKTENLYEFDGKRGYSLGQGQ